MTYKKFLAHQKTIHETLKKLTPHANQYREGRIETKESQRRARISQSLKSRALKKHL